jgi:hypothetical protein
MLCVKGAILLGLALLVAVVATARAGGGGDAAGNAQSITVGCGAVIGTARSGHDSGYRVVLSIVSAPQGFLSGVVHVPQFAPFAYWSKAGMVIRSSTKPVTVTVPKAWRNRLRIDWGNPAPEATAVTFEPCSSAPPTWNGYAGGFFLRGRAACVPLSFTVGRRHATLRFGVGRHC